MSIDSSQEKTTLTETLDPTESGLSSSFPIEMIAQEEGTVPFVGLETPDALPPAVAENIGNDTDRLDRDARSFQEVIEGLPQAELANIHIENLLTVTNGDSVSINQEKIESLDSVSVSEIEAAVGDSLDNIIESATDSASPLLEASGHRAVIDPRRLVLKTLFGVNCQCYWQIASDQYEPGDMQEVLGTQIDAYGSNNAFGWVRFRDWGGDVTITSIFPDFECSPEFDELPDDVSVDGDTFQIAPAEAESEYLEANSNPTIYYGVQISYGFRGLQRLSARPVVYVAEQDTTLPFPDDDDAFTFDRVHRGDFMDSAHERDNNRQSPLEWQQELLSKLQDLSEQIETDIIRSILVSLDFSQYPFSVEEFYEYLGVQNTSQAFPVSVAEEAADRVRDIAEYSGFSCPVTDCDHQCASFEGLQEHHDDEHGFAIARDALDEEHCPQPTPSLWTLQLALKMTIAETYSGSKASDRYQLFTEIAGELLRKPAQQVKLAISEHNYRAEEESDGDGGDEKVTIPENQQTLEDALGDMMDIEGAVGGEVGLTEAQQVQQEVQQKIDNIDSAQS
jgi:hypothetical protein